MSLHIVILPKIWKRTGPQQFRLSPADGSQIFITVHEGDSLVFEPGGPLDEIIENLLTAHANSGLFELRYSRVRPTLDAATDLSAALDLFTLLNETTRPENKAQIPVTNLHGLSAMFARKQLVDLARPMIRQIHQGYVETTERVEPLRGRIDASDLSLALIEKRPQVLCRFDDLTPVMPLFRVIVTALEIASSYGGMIDNVLNTALGGVRSQASAVRKQLRDIHGYNVEEANRIANNITLGSIKPMWRETFTMAQFVLRLAKATLGMGSSRVEIDQLLVRTDDLWERLIVEAAKLRWGPNSVYHSKPGQVSAGLDVPAPWKIKPASSTARNSKPPGRRSSDSYPDLVISIDDRVWVADAKYKRPSGELDRADLYQIFAYSHLTTMAETGAKATSCALLYPAAEGQPIGIELRMFRQPPGEQDLHLDLITLPWPSRRDLRGGLDKYLDGLASCLPDVFGNL